jgi:hypothetical protein
MKPTFFRGWFISLECTHLNRMAVPTFCATSSLTSAPKLAELTFPIPAMCSSSQLVACTDYLRKYI